MAGTSIYGAELKQLYNDGGDASLSPLTYVLGLKNYSTRPVESGESLPGPTTDEDLQGRLAITSAIRGSHLLRDVSVDQSGGPLDVSVGRFSSFTDNGTSNRNEIVLDTDASHSDSIGATISADYIHIGRNGAPSILDSETASIDASTNNITLSGLENNGVVGPTKIDASANVVVRGTLERFGDSSVTGDVSIKTDGLGVHIDITNASDELKITKASNKCIGMTNNEASVTYGFTSLDVSVASGSTSAAIRNANGYISSETSSNVQWPTISKLSFRQNGYTSYQTGNYGEIAQTAATADGQVHTTAYNKGGTIKISEYQSSRQNKLEFTGSDGVILYGNWGGDVNGTPTYTNYIQIKSSSNGGTISMFANNGSSRTEGRIVMHPSSLNDVAIEATSGSNGSYFSDDQNLLSSKGIGLSIGDINYRTPGTSRAATLLMSRQGIQSVWTATSNTSQNKVTGLYLQPRGGNFYVGSNKLTSTNNVNDASTSSYFRGNFYVNNQYDASVTGDFIVERSGIYISNNSRYDTHQLNQRTGIVSARDNGGITLYAQNANSQNTAVCIGIFDKDVSISTAGTTNYSLQRSGILIKHRTTTDGQIYIKADGSLMVRSKDVSVDSSKYILKSIGDVSIDASVAKIKTKESSVDTSLHKLKSSGDVSVEASVIKTKSNDVSVVANKVHISNVNSSSDSNYNYSIDASTGGIYIKKKYTNSDFSGQSADYVISAKENDNRFRIRSGYPLGGKTASEATSNIGLQLIGGGTSFSDSVSAIELESKSVFDSGAKYCGDVNIKASRTGGTAYPSINLDTYSKANSDKKSYFHLTTLDSELYTTGDLNIGSSGETHINPSELYVGSVSKTVDTEIWGNLYGGRRLMKELGWVANTDSTERMFIRSDIYLDSTYDQHDQWYSGNVFYHNHYLNRASSKYMFFSMTLETLSNPSDSKETVVNVYGLKTNVMYIFRFVNCIRDYPDKYRDADWLVNIMGTPVWDDYTNPSGTEWRVLWVMCWYDGSTLIYKPF